MKDRQPESTPQNDVVVGMPETPEEALRREECLEGIFLTVKNIKRMIAEERVGESIARKIDEC